MEEVSPAIAGPFRPFSETQMDFTGIRLSKGYCNNNQYSTQDSENGDLMVSLPESSCSVSGSQHGSESRKVLISRINSPNLNMKESAAADIVVDISAGDEINGSDVPSEKKMISRTESRSLFEFKSVPLYGVTSICGRRPEMEDAVSTIPRFLQSSSGLMSDGRFDPQSTAHFFGVYDGHGGSQVRSIAVKDSIFRFGFC